VENDTLTYARVGGTAPAEVTVSSGGLVLANTTGGQTYTLQCSVTDGKSTPVVKSFTVTIAVTQAGTLIHGSLFTVSGSGFGTRPDYNIGNYTWNGHRHLHYRVTDFADGFPAAGSSKTTFEQYLRGFYPQVNTGSGAVFNSDPVANNIVIEAGGPSRSGKYLRSWLPDNGTSWAKWQGIACRVEDIPAVPVSSAGFLAFKAWRKNNGKMYRFFQSSNGNKNWIFNVDSIYRESEWISGWGNAYHSMASEVWHDIKIALRPTSTPDVDTTSVVWIDGTQFTKNGRLTFPLSNVIDTQRGSEHGFATSLDNSINGGATPAPGSDMRFADIYLDFTEARVELAQGSKRELQPITSWADGAITVAANIGELTPGQATLNVYNASGGVLYSTSVTVQVLNFIPETGFSVAGSVANGGEITITDQQARFGSKPNGVKPLYYWDFESGLNSHATLSRTNYTGPFSGTHDTAVKPVNSSGSMKFDIGTLGNTGIANPMTFTSDDTFVWVKKLYDFSFGGAGMFNLKPFRIWAAGYTHDVLVGTNAGDNTGAADDEGNPRYTVEIPGGTTRWGGFGKAPQNTWVQEEVLYRTSSLDVEDGIFHHFRNAINARADSIRWKFRLSGTYAAKFSMWFLDQKSNAQGIGAANVYYDAIYMDDSWCRVFVSDEATYNTATTGTPTKREIQIPTAWSAGSVSAVVRYGEYASLAGKYLWVGKADGTVLRIGRFANA
jgi:hypothetical protein